MGGGSGGKGRTNNFHHIRQQDFVCLICVRLHQAIDLGNVLFSGTEVEVDG